ncbi:cryptochrome-1b [Misgurnus anguillicaudatus]|uniref:cryptochrome-1b n=1 Tax=Misgurnus anguillicaudatus TaxID=75329 RepID=UPI003CCF564B
MVVNTVHWFRKGLRFHDNPALGESITKADTLRCVYILDPWFAGWITKRGNQQVEKVAKCIIGVHYPKPMINHAEASRINIERMKQIYQQLSCYQGLGKKMLWY